MSLVFEALQRLEVERAASGSAPSPEAVEYLRLVERKGTSNGTVSSRGSYEEERLSDPIESTPLANAAVPVPADEFSFELPPRVRRVVSAVKFGLPFVQSLLQLVDGEGGAAVSTLVSPARPAAPVAEVAPVVERVQIEARLAVEASLVDLKLGHGALCEQFVEQNVSISRIGDHLVMVREATDRNTLELQELNEDLRGVRRRMSVASVVLLGLLSVSIATELLLYLRMLKIIH